MKILGNYWNKGMGHYDKLKFEKFSTFLYKTNLV